MENKTSLTVKENKELLETRPEIVSVAAFDKDEMRRDLTNGLKEFGVGCCEAGKTSLSPLASTMVKHFFNWLISIILQ